MYGAGGDGIQRFAQDTVAGDFINRKHGFQIGRLHVIMHTSLKGENRGVLEIHHCERTHQAVMERLLDFTRLPRIVDLLEKLRKSFSHWVKAQMFFYMHSSPIPIDNLLECIAIKTARV